MNDPVLDRLSGWKEIGQYLRRSARSAQRWERELHLPVRRVKTAHGQVVFASRAELDAWMARFNELPPDAAGDEDSGDRHPVVEAPAPTPPPSVQLPARPTSPVKRVAAAMCLVAAGSFGVARIMPEWMFRFPASVSVFGHVAEARDANGRTVWTHDFHDDVTLLELEGPPPYRAQEVDVNGDGVADRLVPVRFGTRINELRRSDALYAFTATGRVIWSATLPPEHNLTCGGKSIQGPWRISAIATSRGAGPKTTWVAFNHHTQRPGMILEIQPDGRQAIRYIQTGWIMGLTEWTTAGKSVLAAAGVINERARASLVTFDPAQPLTMLKGDQYNCEAEGALPPSAVTLFPTHDVTQAFGYTYDLASGVVATDTGLRMNVAGDSSVAFMNANGRVSEVSFTDGYRLTHDRLFREGRLNHRADACPTLLGTKEIQTWTPSEGWGRYEVPAKSMKAQ